MAEKGKMEYRTVDRADNPGRAVCHGGTGKDCRTGDNAGKNDAGSVDFTYSPGRSFGGFSGIIPGASRDSSQLDGSRGLGGRNPGGRGGCVCGLPPLAHGLYARRRLVGPGPPGRFCGLGKV